jgi:hypothetical protein
VVSHTPFLQATTQDVSVPVGADGLLLGVYTIHPDASGPTALYDAGALQVV